MNDIKKNMMEKFSTSNIIIKTLCKNENKQESLKYYLASKDNENLYFYTGVKVFLDDIYTYDSDQNLQIINGDGEVIKEFKNEKYFHFEEQYLDEIIGWRLEAFITLPLSKPLNFDEFQKKHYNSNIIVEATINEKGIEKLLEKQKKAIQYDANQLYDKIFEEEFELE